MYSEKGGDTDRMMAPEAKKYAYRIARPEKPMFSLMRAVLRTTSSRGLNVRAKRSSRWRKTG